MTEDLLTRIQREMDERLRELRGAVDEHERLAADLRALQDVPEPRVVSEPPAALDVDSQPSAALEAVPEPRVVSEPPAGLGVVSEPPANVVRLPARRPPARTRMVSPKVARLMHAPRRPALERSGVVRVGAARVDSFPGADFGSEDAAVDEIDAEAEVYERAV